MFCAAASSGRGREWPRLRLATASTAAPGTATAPTATTAAASSTAPAATASASSVLLRSARIVHGCGSTVIPAATTLLRFRATSTAAPTVATTATASLRVFLVVPASSAAAAATAATAACTRCARYIAAPTAYQRRLEG